MPSKLFSLFDDQLKVPVDNVAGTPQSLATISSKPEEQGYILGKVRQFEITESKVDYSDFSNFVFFNSALDYFNISAEKILNEYPYDASRDVLDAFVFDLDQYQRYLVSIWPQNTGHVRFNPSVSGSYVVIADVGQTIGDTTETTTQQVGVLSPDTGSLSIEFWCNLSQSLSPAASAIFQKVSSSADGYTVYASGGLMYFRVSSGSVYSEVTAPLVNGQTTYFSFVYDKTDSLNPVLLSFTGSGGSFPVQVSRVTSSFIDSIFIGNSRAFIGSGTIPGRSTSFVSGAFDELRVWKKALSLDDMSGTYNVQAYAQADLMGLWHFNESGSINPDDGNDVLVFDFSGHRIDGRISNYFSDLRASGSLIPFARPDLLLQAYFNSPEIQEMIAEQQLSGSDYDRNNDNLITRMVPENFLNLETIANTTVLQDFLYILARNFDQIKVRIDQFTKVLRANYGMFNQAPDALLGDVARFFGWEFTGNFLSADAFQYLLGKNVLANQDANKELDIKLYQIKNEFWKRTLVNLMHLYKSKGTREGVESFLRLYGVDNGFVRLKEYGYRPNVGIQTNRIHVEKSVYALAFCSGSSLNPLPTTSVSSTFSSTDPLSVETRVLFPTETTSHMTASINSGSIWSLMSSGSTTQLLYFKGDPSSSTGSLFIYKNGVSSVSLPNVGIFDGKWYNVVYNTDVLSGSLNIDVRRLDIDEIGFHVSGTTYASLSGSSSSQTHTFQLGSSGSFRSQHWLQEARVWTKTLSETEMADHVLNFQSYGTERLEDTGNVACHMRLNEGMSASLDGTLPVVYDISSNGKKAQSSGFVPSVNPYTRFLLDYNYIASLEFGWNEDKIRIFEGSEVNPGDVFYDSQTLALEFNMIDALNEDISQMISTIDEFNNAIGNPANRYRGSYQDLERLGRKYFSRLQGRLNFRVFSDMLEFFDQSFIKMVQKLLPARAVFLGDEFVVESHMLERPKMQWNYRRQTRPFIPEGSITIYIRM